MTARNKLYLIFGLALCFLVGLFFAGKMFNEYGGTRTEKVLRYARMIDTEAVHRVSKSSHTYNTRGYFVDNETGLRFGDSIGDTLYRQFAEGGNKGIDVSWPYSIDKREQTSKGVFFQGTGWLMMIFSCVFIAVVTCAFISDFRKLKNGRD